MPTSAVTDEHPLGDLKHQVHESCGQGKASKAPPSRKEREKDGAPDSGEALVSVWIGDPAEAQYLETSVEHLLEVAGRLAENGLVRMNGEFAVANDGLMAQAEKFEGAMRTAVEELEKKHAFERG